MMDVAKCCERKEELLQGLNQEPDLERAGVKLKLERVTQEDFLGSCYNGCSSGMAQVLRT